MKRSQWIRSAFTAVVLVFAALQSLGGLSVSNLEEMSTGSGLAGSDAWFAQVFTTGTDAAGYFLNSVQLRTDVASGTPSGFEAYIYSSILRSPEQSLGALA